ncbi:MAG TPA: type VI secretion system-associated protein TagF [Stellaceae bacterium]|jgi:type VI secretion system protein ImpM
MPPSASEAGDSQPLEPPAPPEAEQDPNAPGLFGKLPSHGDFVARNLPPALRVGWEAWLDAGLERSRQMLGDKWLEIYLSSPVWNFAVASGCCGGQAFAGVMIPSVDRIGRYFPLSILAPVSPQHTAAEIALGGAAWFERIEAAALSCLADDFEFAGFERDLAREVFPALGPNVVTSLEVPLADEAGLGDMSLLLGRLLERSGVRYSLWWTSGSPSIAACCRAFHGLPPPEEFARLLG